MFVLNTINILEIVDTIIINITKVEYKLIKNLYSYQYLQYLFYLKKRYIIY